MDNQPQTGETTQNVKKSNAKIIIGIVIIVIIILLGFYAKHALTAATVNGESISRISIIQQLEKQSGKQALDTLIIEKLINSEAEKRNITVDPKDIDSQIATVEGQIKAQGSTLDAELARNGLTLDELKRQLTVQKKLEAIVADKTQVTEDDVTKYIKDHALTVPAGQETAYRNQVRVQVSQDKLTAAIKAWVADAKKNANIQYFPPYAAI